MLLTMSLQQSLYQEPLDLLIIGAGIYGIQAARTYLSVHPTHNILVLEADAAIGGVWSKNRIYPHFFTQSPLGIWEYSDIPLEIPESEKNELYHYHFPARHFSTYLENYASAHVFAGKSVSDRILCGTKVEKLWMEGGIWKASTSAGKLYPAYKIIDATGLTSIPDIPSFTGSGSFRGIQIHSKDFGRYAPSILKPQARIVVVGGGKSAGDIAFACAKSGAQEVHWVIRKSGNGPAAYLPAEAPIQRYESSNSAFHTSFMATLIANIYTPETWWTWFLYRTVVGRLIFTFIWKGLQYDVFSRARYDRPGGEENGFFNLKPDGDLFWQFASSGIAQRPDFFDIISSKVKVHRADIDRISSGGVLLQSGDQIEADAFIFATGWKASTPFFDPHTAYGLGLATDSSVEASHEIEQKKWAHLETKIDHEVCRRFPILSTTQHHQLKPLSTTPFRLYRSMFPTTITEPTIAFLGKTDLANHTYNAEIQALYATAVFGGNLRLPEKGKMEADVALVSTWMKRRYPTKGRTGCFFFFDLLPYTDKLLEELEMGGIKEKRGLFRSVAARDLEGILEEYSRRRNGEKDKKTA
ncbi:hypothetical protein SVAN01_11659 [Stagonosporopsis vannaccii]|nr:hypothetical protein SVAN01_11659 [Stagonosporopsis vannaccii]